MQFNFWPHRTDGGQPDRNDGFAFLPQLAGVERNGSGTELAGKGP